MLQVFFPLFLIVACSWVAFFIVKTDVPARCGLGVTTVLSITKLGFGGSKPQVPYATAIDAFVIIRESIHMYNVCSHGTGEGEHLKVDMVLESEVA